MPRSSYQVSCWLRGIVISFYSSIIFQNVGYHANPERALLVQSRRQTLGANRCYLRRRKNCLSQRAIPSLRVPARITVDLGCMNFDFNNHVCNRTISSTTTSAPPEPPTQGGSVGFDAVDLILSKGVLPRRVLCLCWNRQPFRDPRNNLKGFYRRHVLGWVVHNANPASWTCFRVRLEAGEVYWARAYQSSTGLRPAL